MKNRFFTHLLIFSTVILGLQCTKAPIELISEPVTGYVNLQPGKYIIYRLDSTIKIPFNDTGFVVHSYIVKDQIDKEIYSIVG